MAKKNGMAAKILIALAMLALAIGGILWAKGGSYGVLEKTVEDMEPEVKKNTEFRIGAAKDIEHIKGAVDRIEKKLDQ